MAEDSSPLTFRDTIRHLLPTAAAIALFAPLWTDEKLDVSALVFVSVLLGYVITTPLTKFLGWFYSFTPAMKARWKQRQWIASNWDFDELFLNRLSQEEKEYTYLTGGYGEFYRQLAFYLLIYASINALILVQAILTAPPDVGLLQIVLTTTTPVAGKLKLPTGLLAGMSALLGIYSFWDFINEYGSIFLENGIYDKFAKKSHAEKGQLACNVWGVARHEEEPAPGVEIQLTDYQGNKLQSVVTDSEGLFQFKNRFKDIAGKGGKLKAMMDGAAEVVLQTDLKWVPEVSLEVPQFTLKKTRKGWLGFFASLILLAAMCFQCLIVPDAISILDLAAVLPFLVFVTIFLTGKQGLMENWKFSAALLTATILAGTNVFWLLYHQMQVASVKPHFPPETTSVLTSGWYRYIPPLMLITVYFIISRLSIESKISEKKQVQQAANKTTQQAPSQ